MLRWKNLTISNGSLTPVFAADVIEYTVNVPNIVTSITVTGIANHSGATVEGNVTGKLLNVGNNPITLTVIAEDKTTTKTYTVTLIRAEAITGVEDGFANDLNIYPNPFTGEVRITGAVAVETWHAASLQIINAAGTVLHTQIITSPGETVKLEDLPAGVYFLRLVKDGKTKTVKVVKIQ